MNSKDISTKNGLNLEEELEHILREIDKRDIKRIYTKLDELSLTNDATTFEIISAMQENTIALLNIENDAPQVKEIGSRTGGVMIIIKKSSVYFSCGLFITYRYGRVFFGYSGLAGESFIWNENVKTIHSYHNSSKTTLSKVNEYEKLTNWGGQAVNPLLTIKNDSIIIPEDVNNIIIDGCVVMECLTNGTKFLQVFKNDEDTNLMVKQTTTINNENITLSIPRIMIPVKKGDKIDLRVYSNSLDSLRMKHFNVEVVD